MLIAACFKGGYADEGGQVRRLNVTSPGLAG